MSVISATSPLGRILYGCIAMILSLVVIEALYFLVANPTQIPATHAVPSWDEIVVPELDSPTAVEIFQPLIDRSLFSWNRRPIVADQPQVELNDGDIESRWGLSGIVAAGDSSYAMFRSLLDEEPVRLQLGMYLEQWRVDEITSEVVNLSAEGKKKQFRLNETVIKGPRKVRRRNISRRDKKTSSLRDAEQALMLAEDEALVPVLRALMEAKEAESKKSESKGSKTKAGRVPAED